MNKKRYLIGGAVIVFAFCATMAFNVSAFPSVLAMTAEKSQVKSVVGTGLETLIATAQKEIDAQNVNMISEEKAVEIAIEHYKLNKNDNVYLKSADPNKLNYKTRLVKHTAPVNGATWSIAFSTESWIYSVCVDAMTGEVFCTKIRLNDSSIVQDGNYLGFFLKGWKNDDETDPYIAYAMYDDEGLLVAVFEISKDDMENGSITFPPELAGDYGDISITFNPIPEP